MLEIAENKLKFSGLLREYEYNNILKVPDNPQ